MLKKTILITGGAGFLGKNLALKLGKNYKVVLGSRNNFFAQQASIETNCEITPLDVVNIESVRDSINKYKPEIVIHAAATKYVDLAEKNPNECIDINILGSQNVARVSIENNVKIVIGISTDKASPPFNNIYGLSKSLMEKLFSNLAKISKTKFTCVRFGNIAWSTGSVFPIWYQMMQKNNIIYSTGPNMRRFFFSLDEASELVIISLKNINKLNGKIFSKKMKSSQISDILNLWCKYYKCKWKKINSRIGDKTDEHLIGFSEINYTYEYVYKKQKYLIIDFNNKNKKSIKKEFSTFNSKKLNKTEILELIKNKPRNLV